MGEQTSQLILALSSSGQANAEIVTEDRGDGRRHEVRMSNRLVLGALEDRDGALHSITGYDESRRGGNYQLGRPRSNLIIVRLGKIGAMCATQKAHAGSAAYRIETPLSALAPKERTRLELVHAGIHERLETLRQ